MDCGSDGTFQVATFGKGGNSNFQPAHIIGTNSVVIPVAFSNVSGSFTDPDGNTQTFHEDDVSRHAPAHANLVNCHFSFSASGPDGSVSFGGDAVLYIPGK